MGALTIHTNETTAAVDGGTPALGDFDLRLRHVRRLLTMDGLDLADDQVMRDAWR
jgi:hypothetical protein